MTVDPCLLLSLLQVITYLNCVSASRLGLMTDLFDLKVIATDVEAMATFLFAENSLSVVRGDVDPIGFLTDKVMVLVTVLSRTSTS